MKEMGMWKEEWKRKGKGEEQTGVVDETVSVRDGLFDEFVELILGQDVAQGAEHLSELLALHRPRAQLVEHSERV